MTLLGVCTGRFLQAEAGPWGHLSPSPRSPTRTPTISPGTVSSSSHLSPGASPGGPSPTSPCGSASGVRGPGPKQYRGRTSSMPAVPRHRVRARRGGVKEPKRNRSRTSACQHVVEAICGLRELRSDARYGCTAERAYDEPCVDR